MVFSETLKKSIYFSLAGHLAVFTAFSLSFGRNIPPADYAPVAFWGQFLRPQQISQPFIPANTSARGLFFGVPRTPAIAKVQPQAVSLEPAYIKPHLDISGPQEKPAFVIPAAFAPVFKPSRVEPTILFRPLLPSSFILYFNDRQVAHVELSFNITPSRDRNIIAIKRKVSSGNPEVDLLTMRYISRYLFIQQAQFSPQDWQTVKIDLSAKE